MTHGGESTRADRSQRSQARQGQSRTDTRFFEKLRPFLEQRQPCLVDCRPTHDQKAARDGDVTVIPARQNITSIDPVKIEEARNGFRKRGAGTDPVLESLA